MKKLLHAVLSLAVALNSAAAADWNQAAGPNSNFQNAESAPTTWSVVNNDNIAWKITLPETGQSTPVVFGDRVFFTTMKPVEANSETGSDIVAWCCSAKTGDVLWQREIVGKYPLRLSGCFSDSSAPPAVCDGMHVIFINASGTIACFDLDGNPIWSKPILTAGRTLPFLHDGNVVFIRQTYVLKCNAKTLDEKAIVAINDLGPVGQAWTRASISFAGGKAFAHTIRELICIADRE